MMDVPHLYDLVTENHVTIYVALSRMQLYTVNTVFWGKTRS